MAGTVRNTLGSTDSDNAGELGNKITTGLQNQLESQAISTTEGIINDKANQFVNQFGAGRSEINIHGLNSKALDYSLKTIQPLSELNHNSKDLTFFQGQVTSGDNQGNRRETINLGIGHRILVEDDRAIAGINLFHDYETKSAHKRLSLGLEYQRTNFDISANAYHPLSDKKTIIADTTTTEEALAGYDIRLTGQAPYLPWATIKGTHYFWDSKAGDNIKGNVVGIEVKLTPSISFEFGQEYTNTNSKSYGKLNVKLPFDDNQPLTHFAIADTAFKASSKMDLGALDWVERDNKIQVEKVEVDGDVVDINECPSMVAGGFTYPVVAIGNQCWTAENMKHAVTTGNTWNYNDTTSNQLYKDDGYGLLYDWVGAMNGSTTEGAQGICAVGWHIPSDDEFHLLENTYPTNSSGFDWIFAGQTYTNGYHYGQDSQGYLWSSTKSDKNFLGWGAWYAILFSGNNNLSRNSMHQGFSLSVRCLKD